MGKKKAFTKNQKKWADDKKGQEAALSKIKKYCKVVRLVAHTQMKLLPLKQKKAHIIELQVNGGDSAAKVDMNNGSTTTDITVKSINPVGGFPHYGEVKNDFLMIKGSCMGVRKRPICLRRPMYVHHKRKDL